VADEYRRVEEPLADSAWWVAGAQESLVDSIAPDSIAPDSIAMPILIKRGDLADGQAAIADRSVAPRISELQ
jgi:hypothetical protein